MWASIPAVLAFSTSSANALAVIAIIGTVAASGLFIARISFVAARPSTTGIITSISTTSISPTSLFLNASTACSPSVTDVTFAPATFSMNSTISVFILLSSATRTLIPSSFLSSLVFSESVPFFAFSDILKSTFTVKVVPSPFLLSTDMFQPALSMIFLTIASPKPTPSGLFESNCFSRSNGSYIFCINSSSIPIPVSEHFNSNLAVSSLQPVSMQVRTTFPSALLYFMALFIRLVRILLN